MEDGGKEHMDMNIIPTATGDVDQGALPPATRAAKPPPGLPRSNLGDQKNMRAASVEMGDDTTNGGSAASSDTASVSNQESTATSISTTSYAQPSSPPTGTASGETHDFGVKVSPSLPSIDEQIKKVYGLWQTPPVEGQEGYVLSVKWLERVMARATEGVTPGQYDKAATEGDVGPVDNSELVDRSKWMPRLLHVLGAF
jgi:ubiquitin carboxyl-terminal hydrolase 4/11/15